MSGLMFVGGRYYDPATGRFLTPDHSRMNPYAPVQGPGIWLLLPLVGLVLAWKGRKKGPGRMVVLVCLVGVGMTLVSCGEQPTPTPQPAPPILPTSTIALLEDAPTHTPQATQIAPVMLPDTTLLEMSVGINIVDEVVECVEEEYPDLVGEIQDGQGIAITSLGTFIDNRTILTHGHYGPEIELGDYVDFVTYQNEVDRFNLVDIEVDRVGGAGTWLFRLPRPLQFNLTIFPQLGDADPIVEGDQIQVVYSNHGNYWDELHKPAGVLTTEVTLAAGARIGDSPVVGFSDPTIILNRGDSGGGIYWNGGLVGNLWQNPEENPTLKFFAKVPRGIN